VPRPLVITADVAAQRRIHTLALEPRVQTPDDGGTVGGSRENEKAAGVKDAACESSVAVIYGYSAEQQGVE
jgi:hypothetical protein